MLKVSVVDKPIRRKPQSEVNWRGYAACQDTEPELFFDPQTKKEAIKVCESCPVRLACLAQALRFERHSDWNTWGIWGGLTRAERLRLG